MMRSMWSMLRRWITTFITIGQPWSLMILPTLFFNAKVLVCDRKSFISRVESWNDNCTWSSPAAFNAAARASVRPTPEVSRLL